MKMLFIVVVIGFLTGLPVSAGWCQEDKPIVEQWRDVLRFGIDTEVLKVIKSIAEAEEQALNQELTVLFAESLNFEVRKAVLDYFSEQKIRDAEAASFAVLNEELLDDSRLIMACIRYLTALGSPGLETRLLEYVDHRDALIAESAITGLGEIGGVSSGASLVERLQDPEYPAEQKPEIILALGKMKYSGALDTLIAIVDNRDEDRIWRMYAAASLGEIGEQRAIPHLRALFTESDSLLKAYAASALGQFDMAEVENLLQQGLRDSNVRVRVAAAKGLANEQARGSVDILIYKAKYDPERQVRLQAIESLGAIGTAQAFDYLRELYADKIALLLYREAAFTALCENALGENLDTFRGVIEQEWGSKDQKVVEFTAKKLSVTEAPGLKWFYERFLDSPSVYVRIYGLRGIERNRLRILREKVEKVSESDPYPAARQVALSVLSRL
ncbi:MAG: HEAT repeat domain-containing protein [Spirochaetaceae bacterium]|nr:MAG: HEAT repeat domain-containing protein [Spirochaetaceae bacterium]